MHSQRHKNAASSGNGEGVGHVAGYIGRLAGDEAKSDAQLMKSPTGFEKDVLH